VSRVSTAVVLMAYGSPERLADVPAYYADIRGGRPIRPELLADLTERYRRLGVEEHNPLNAITEETRAALEQELGIPVFTGMKHWEPRIAEAAERALAQLQEAARSDGVNLMPPIIDAARAYVTMGEMCDALREVWGVWRETPVF
jgi:protoheme ferro-lyase